MATKEAPPSQPTQKPEGQQLGFREKARFIFTNMTVEPIILLFLLPSVMVMISVANLNLEKACRVNLKLNETICDGLAARNSSMYNSSDESAVQKSVASMNAWKNVVQSVIPSCLLLFFGSWSDRHNRRKPFILLPILGEIITLSGLLLCTYFFYELSMEFTGLTECIPTSLSGGWFTMYMAIFSYISVISSVESRTIRIGFVNIVNNASMMIGIALSGILYKAVGLYGVFSLALSMFICGFFYGMFKIKEYVPENTPQIEIPKKEKSGFVTDFFDFKHIVETFRVAFKPRQKNRRTRICVIMVLVMLVIGPIHGEINVIYLFVRKKFQWNEIDFSIYYTYNVVVHMLGTIVSLSLFSKYLKMDDALLGMISSTSKVLSCFVYAFAPTSSVFYLGVVVEILNGTSFIALRSIISKLVPSDELGKINSLFGVCEALMPLVYGPMYSLIYRSTIDVMPGTFFLVGGALTFPAILIFFWLYIQHKRDGDEEKLDQAHKEELLKTGENGIRIENFAIN